MQKVLQLMTTQLRSLWNDAQEAWQREGLCDNPLQEPEAETRGIESTIRSLIVGLLNVSGEERQELYRSARRIRDLEAGKYIDLRAVVEASNVCRANCTYCPMRRPNLGSVISPAKLTAPRIVEAARTAYEVGIRELFIQSGEDRSILRPVHEALTVVRRIMPEYHIVLNLGDLDYDEYRTLRNAGAEGYLIKHETANPRIHAQTRPHSTFPERVRHMLLARRAGMYIGTGTIVGLPGQTNRDLADDVLFAGKVGSYRMVSCSPFTPSDSIPLRNHPAGDFYTTLNLIAIYRHLFPVARIPAVSNLDNPLLTSRPSDLGISGQSTAIDAGANGVTINYTPKEARDAYSIYDDQDRRQVILLDKARRVAGEAGLPLKFHNASYTIAS